MEPTSENRDRIIAAVEVDRLFTAFEIEMNPSEALTFAGIVPTDGVPKLSNLHSLIERINAAIPTTNFRPEHPQTGLAHHHFRIGRERGQRVLKIEIFKGFFQVDYDFMGLLEVLHSLGTGAGAKVVVEADNNSYAVVLRWDGW